MSKKSKNFVGKRAVHKIEKLQIFKIDAQISYQFS
jgi:hypothetical protein